MTSFSNISLLLDQLYCIFPILIQLLLKIALLLYLLVYFMLYVVLTYPLSYVLKSHACVKSCCVSKLPCSVSITLPGNVLVSV